MLLELHKDKELAKEGRAYKTLTAFRIFTHCGSTVIIFGAKVMVIAAAIKLQPSPHNDSVVGAIVFGTKDTTKRQKLLHEHSQ